MPYQSSMASDSRAKTFRHQRGFQGVTVRVLFGLLLLCSSFYWYSSYPQLLQSIASAACSENTKGNISVTFSSSASLDMMSTSLASRHSFGFFDDISDLMWSRLQRRVLAKSWYFNPSHPLENIDQAGKWIERNMLPNFNCPHRERVGSKVHEGSKFVCNVDRLVRDDKPDCLIYSIGSAGDFKFEDAIATIHHQKCEIHVFDPANWTRPGDVENKNIHYHVWGFRSTYDLESKSVVWPKGRRGGFKTFPETLVELGHQNRTIDIFKIDCEGCEWSTHRDWIRHDIRQIFVELHGVPRPDGDAGARWYKKPMHLVDDYFKDFADNGFALFSKERNGELGLELSFLKLHPDFWKAELPST